MKKFKLLLAILIAIIIFFGCKKDFLFDPDLKASVQIKSFEQSDYEEYGYFDDSVFHHILDAFQMRELEDIVPDNDTVIGFRGNTFTIIKGITYIKIDSTLHPIIQNISYGTAEIKCDVENKGMFNIGYYEILLNVRCSDTILECAHLGYDIPVNKIAHDMFYFDTDERRIIDIEVKDYHLFDK